VPTNVYYRQGNSRPNAHAWMDSLDHGYNVYYIVPK